MSNLDAAHLVAKRLAAAGFRALFAGGAVRDLAMGEEPHDVDVATDAVPDEVMALFEKTVPVGAQFGVVLVLPDGLTPVEVATFRTDGGYSDHRRPDTITYASDREDALRRDLTINGLFQDPLTGQIIDYVGGLDDIERGVIRAIGDPEARFGEDRLRLLRAVRFAARYHFRIDGATYAALRRHASSLVTVSGERVRDELTRMLTEGDAATAIELLDACGLLAVVLPEVKALQGVAQPLEYHPEGDVWEHTLLLLQMLEKPTLTLAWGALLHDIGKPPTQEFAPDRIRFNNHPAVGAAMSERLLRRLKFPGDALERIEALVRDHLKFTEVRRMRQSTLLRFLRGPNFDEYLALHRIDCLASHGKLDLWHFCRDKLAAIPPEVLKPPPLLSGHDLIAEGYAPGPLFKEILASVEDAQLEGLIASREQAMAFVREGFPPGGAAT